MDKEKKGTEMDNNTIDLEFYIDNDIDIDFTVSENKEEPADLKSEIISWVKTIGFAIVVALFINNYIIINANVPTPSMESTIMVGDRVIAFRWNYFFEEPERGDIIVFKFPDNEKKPFVKRLIGLPNEKIEIKNGSVYINDSILEEPYLKETPYGDYGPFYVPEGHYFMMGDNRNNSDDSRFWKSTYLAKDKILGRVIFKYYPNVKIMLNE